MQKKGYFGLVLGFDGNLIKLFQIYIILLMSNSPLNGLITPDKEKYKTTNKEIILAGQTSNNELQITFFLVLFFL